MLANSQNNKMMLLTSCSTTNNEWPQNHQIDEKGVMASTGSNGRAITEKPNLEQQHQQLQQPLKCPRCDSSNTKFCYYNNYSLSQPRHFCKACKRYWTRGGTLRNVPVGGGCRKNKKIKRSSSAPSSSSSSQNNTPNSSIPPIVQSHNHHQIDLSSTSNQMNSLFYGLPTNPSELNLPYQSFNSSRVSGYDTVHHPQLISALGLGFSSGLLGNEVNGENYRNGYDRSNKQIQEIVTSSPNSLLSSYHLFGSSSASTSTSTSSPTMASLLASTIQHQNNKFISCGLKDVRGGNNFHGFSVGYEEDMQMPAAADCQAMKEVKMESSETQQNNKFYWNMNGIHIPCQSNQIEQIAVGSSSSSDPSLLWNPSGNVGAWLDPSIIGSSSSVPSLI